MKLIQIILTLTLFSFICSCQKGEQGDIGPAGGKGNVGATGDKGEVGLSDSKGMLISEWVEVKAAEWEATSSTTFRKVFTLPSLTTNIADKGNVYYYMQPSGTNFVYPLPYSEAYGRKFVANLVRSASNQTQALSINYNIIPELGGIKLTTNYKFRVVIIPAAARMVNGIDWNNYESVKNYLDLND